MAETTPGDRPRTIIDALEDERPSLGRFGLLLAILVVAGLCGVLTWLSPAKKQPSLSITESGNWPASHLAISSSIEPGRTSFVMTKVGVGGKDDLFLCTSTTVLSPSCRNLTRSPAVSETQLALSPDAEHVAYYGMADSGTELYLLSVDEQSVLPLTLRAGESGLHVDFRIAPVLRPAFSTDGNWVAFPADDGRETFELFVARQDGQEVRRVTDLGHQVCDYIWLNDRVLVVAVRWSDKTLHYWIARLESGDFELEPLP
jgi:hypothetical protein